MLPDNLTVKHPIRSLSSWFRAASPAARRAIRIVAAIGSAVIASSATLLLSHRTEALYVLPIALALGFPIFDVLIPAVKPKVVIYLQAAPSRGISPYLKARLRAFDDRFSELSLSRVRLVYREAVTDVGYGTWLVDEILAALIERASAIVLELPEYDAQPAVEGPLAAALGAVSRTGVLLAYYGDGPVLELPSHANVLQVSHNPAIGGSIAGQLLTRELENNQRARGILCVRATPESDRPRAAYAALVVLCSEARKRCTAVSVTDSADVAAVISALSSMFDSRESLIYVSCLSDTHARSVARAIASEASIPNDLVRLIGYDGVPDVVDGSYMVEVLPVTCVGTVDSLPAEQGAAMARELWRSVAGSDARTRRLAPAARVFGPF